VALTTGKTGCRTKPYSTSSGVYSGSSAVRSKNGVSTNVLSKSNHTQEGGYNREQCTGQSKEKVRVHFQKLGYMQRFV
jgi:hypothetical protein